MSCYSLGGGTLTMCINRKRGEYHINFENPFKGHSLFNMAFEFFFGDHRPKRQIAPGKYESLENYSGPYRGGPFTL